MLFKYKLELYILERYLLIFFISLSDYRISLVAQMGKHLSTTWEIQVWALSWEDPLGKEMAIHSSTIAWKTPLTKETCRLQSMGLQRVRHNWVTSLSDYIKSHTYIHTSTNPHFAWYTVNHLCEDACLLKSRVKVLLIFHLLLLSFCLLFFLFFLLS